MNTNVLKPKALRGLALVSAVALAGGWGVGFAQEDTDTFEVSATVAESCHIDSTENITLGTFDPFSGDSASGELVIRCTNGTGYEVGLTSAGVLTRDGGTETINYDLFQDSGHSTAWDNVNNKRSDTGNGEGQTHTVFVDIPEQPTALVGDYSETVTVTVDFASEG